MKKLSSLIVFLLITFSMTAISYATGDGGCGGGTPELCPGYTTLSDKILFTQTGISDTSNSPTPGGVLNGYGGSNVNILDNTNDYVNWTHKFTFVPPPVNDTTAIIKASLSISLVDFSSNIQDDDRDHEHDNYGNDKHDEHGNIIMRGHKKNDKGEDDREEYSISFNCNYNNDSSSSAKILLEGEDHWRNIQSIHDQYNNEFAVKVKTLYDGSFTVELKSTLNDFKIEWSRLDIEYCPATTPPVPPVPEPSTFLLLGVGLLGAGLVRRRIRT